VCVSRRISLVWKVMVEGDHCLRNDGGEPLSSHCPHNYGSPQARLLLLAMHKVHALSEQPRELALQLAKANLPRMSPECVCCISSSCTFTSATVVATTSPPATVAAIATTDHHHRSPPPPPNQPASPAHHASSRSTLDFLLFLFLSRLLNAMSPTVHSLGWLEVLYVCHSLASRALHALDCLTIRTSPHCHSLLEALCVWRSFVIHSSRRVEGDAPSAE
jgi:hypothetical protein